MISDKHLKYFKVENFKAFESLELNDIGQFNLIAGDNNVGKTSILEALLFDENINILTSRLKHAYIQRNDIENGDVVNEFNYLSDYYNKKIKADTIKYFVQKGADKRINNYELRNSSLELLSANQLEGLQTKLLLNHRNFKNVAILDQILNDEERVSIIDFQHELEDDDASYSPIVFYNLGYGRDLVRFYSEKVQKSKENKGNFVDNLKTFIPAIEDIEIVPSEIMKNYSSISIRTHDADELIPLSMFGEGANKLFRILAEIQIVKGKILMIDEIDTGIHYSRFKDFWKTIIKSASDNNVQLFATTHNLECLNYFKKALEDDEMVQYQKSARHFLVEKLNNGQTKTFTYNFEQFESALDLGNEIRGGK
jgi:AAA15 family ATPase/GTPase